MRRIINKSKLLLIGIIFMIAFTLSVNAANEITIDLSKSDADLTTQATSSGGAFEYDITNEVVIIKQGNIILTGTTSDKVVEVANNYSGNITLDNLNIDASGSIGIGAIRILDNVNITLLLKGESNLKSGYDKAGIYVGNNSTLTIDTKYSNNKLNVSGGYGGAGIGSGFGEKSTGDIIINGGNIKAIGGDYGAGIGSGYGNISLSQVGTITISGGSVEASGEYGGAGIGSGMSDFSSSQVGTIIIIGGIIKASGGDYGAGIGSGHGVFSLSLSQVDIITISGGTIKTTKGAGAFADIGKGANNNNSIVNNVNIKGGSINANMINPQPTDTINNVYLNKLKVDSLGLNKNKEITDININSYGINDVKTDDNAYLYLYLPESSNEEDVSVKIDNNSYGAYYQRTQANEYFLAQNILKELIKINKPEKDRKVQTSLSGLNYSGNVKWYDGNNNEVNKFKAGERYNARVELKAKDGYRWISSSDIRVNNGRLSNKSLIGYNNQNSLSFDIGYDKLKNDNTNNKDNTNKTDNNDDNNLNKLPQGGIDSSLIIVLMGIGVVSYMTYKRVRI